jgi:hypothetical protein
MKLAILCGGKGTRLGGHAESIPKPLVEIGRRPILWHMRLLGWQLCVGLEEDLRSTIAWYRDALVGFGRS